MSSVAITASDESSLLIFLALCQLVLTIDTLPILLVCSEILKSGKVKIKCQHCLKFQEYFHRSCIAIHIMWPWWAKIVILGSPFPNYQMRNR